MLLKKKKCTECLSTIENDWDFCPRCGEPLNAENSFENIFEDMEKLFTFPEVKFSDYGDSGGISISIVSGTGLEPKVSIKTSGKFKEMEPELRKQLAGSVPTLKSKETKRRAVKFEKTEEPKMEVKKSKNELTYRIKLPGIVSLRSVDVKKLPNSIEIRAAAGNKLYFKLFEVPEGFEIIEKNFKYGILFLSLKRQ
ncbi:MAG: zinc ribbon domain-containing protein [Candidatus Aenigmarchaeota archaeon]|nr:zinc ribbon domain-containing protein [Candidatus Aenigmarchaeota archaeon]